MPVQLGVIDYARKEVRIENVFIPTGDIEADLRAVKNFYRPFKGKYPEKFSAD